MKILIVDDSPVIQDRLVKMVSHVHNAKVVGVASNGGEAILSIQKLKPDLLILDLHMPVVNGFDVLRNIKKNNLSTTVLVLTNFATVPHRELCTQLGIKYFFDKTTEFEQAIEVIENLASSCQAEQLTEELEAE
jgi:two-component system, NarL family, response regulator DevR